jgi:hypothetical protein
MNLIKRHKDEPEMKMRWILNKIWRSIPKSYAQRERKFDKFHLLNFNSELWIFIKTLSTHQAPFI